MMRNSLPINFFLQMDISRRQNLREVNTQYIYQYFLPFSRDGRMGSHYQSSPPRLTYLYSIPDFGFQLKIKYFIGYQFLTTYQ